MKNMLDIIVVLLTLLPTIVALLGWIGQKTHNEKIKNLSERASVIVTALDQSGFSNSQKKDKAFDSLSLYAEEVGIKVTPEQISEYIESSVNFIRVNMN